MIFKDKTKTMRGLSLKNKLNPIKRPAKLGFLVLCW
jgi:hypothetical protein